MIIYLSNLCGVLYLDWLVFIGNYIQNKSQKIKVFIAILIIGLGPLQWVLKAMQIKYVVIIFFMIWLNYTWIVALKASYHQTDPMLQYLKM